MELDKKILEQFLELSKKYDIHNMPDSVKIALMNALAMEEDLKIEEKEIVESIFDKISRNINKFGNVLVENWKPIALGLAILTVVLYHSNKIEKTTPLSTALVVAKQSHNAEIYNEKARKYIFEKRNPPSTALVVADIQSDAANTSKFLNEIERKVNVESSIYRKNKEMDEQYKDKIKELINENPNHKYKVSEKMQKRENRNKLNKFLRMNIEDSALFEENKQNYIRENIWNDIKPDSILDNFNGESEGDKNYRQQKNKKLYKILRQDYIPYREQLMYGSKPNFKKDFAKNLANKAEIKNIKIDDAILKNDLDFDKKQMVIWFENLIKQKELDLKSREENRNSYGKFYYNYDKSEDYEKEEIEHLKNMLADGGVMESDQILAEYRKYMNEKTALDYATGFLSATGSAASTSVHWIVNRAVDAIESISNSFNNNRNNQFLLGGPEDADNNNRNNQNLLGGPEDAEKEQLQLGY